MKAPSVSRISYKIKSSIVQLLEKTTGYAILLTKRNKLANYNDHTAIKSKFGFWYIGNILDQQDLAYGIMRIGEIEPDSTALCLRILAHLAKQHRQAIFFDVGSNTGYYTILAGYTHSQNVQAYGFEPMTSYCLTARASIALNSLQQNCYIFETALSDSTKQSALYIAGSGSSLNYQFLPARTPHQAVETTTLDTILKEKNIPRPHFMLIDIESHEFEMLTGATQTIQASTPVIYYESAKTRRDNQFTNNKFEATQQLLQQLGYVLYRHDDESLIPVTNRQDTPDGIHMYLALHPKHHSGLIHELIP